MASSLNLLLTCDPNPIHASRNLISTIFKFSGTTGSQNFQSDTDPQSHQKRRRFCVAAITKGSVKQTDSEKNIPAWARPDSEEPPPWARGEGKPLTQGFVLPYYAYLIASAVTAIAAIGSAFEYSNQKPVFGILKPDSNFYAPLLGLFVFTGIPSAAFLWFKSVQAANKESEEQDKSDGYS